MVTTTKRLFAFFITPHGYGHAARAAAVMNSIREQVPEVCFEIFTRVPVWFFNVSVQTSFHYHELLSDIGLVQDNAMTQNLPETVRRLDAMLPYRPALVEDLARQVSEAGCEMVVCDIAGLGIAVAKAAGLPALLEENFTWDWIYAGYLDQELGFARHIAYLREVFESADYHVRTEPACAEDLPADLVTEPISRKPRVAPEVTRARLGVAQDIPMVLITMGGIATQYPFLERLVNAKDVRFLIPGGSDHYEQRGSLVLIPHHSDFYHPDMVKASNAVIGKLGYSTLAEAYSAGLPFGYVPREQFPESPPLARFVQATMRSIELSEARFFSGAWLDMLPELLAYPRQRPGTLNGADQLAKFILSK